MSRLLFTEVWIYDGRLQGRLPGKALVEGEHALLRFLDAHLVGPAAHGGG